MSSGKTEEGLDRSMGYQDKGCSRGCISSSGHLDSTDNAFTEYPEHGPYMLTIYSDSFPADKYGLRTQFVKQVCLTGGLLQSLPRKMFFHSTELILLHIHLRSDEQAAFQTGLG
jgi:hypothetical protein